MTRNSIITAGLLCTALSAPAFGSTLKTFTNVAAGNSNVVSISNDGGSSFVQGYAGRYAGRLGSVDINDFCVDLGHDVNFGQSYAADVNHNISDAAGAKSADNYYSGGLSSAINDGYIPNYGGAFTNQQRADQVAYLIHTYGRATSASFNNGFDLNTNLAAIGMSIWDIENDGGDGIAAGRVVGDGTTIANYAGLVATYETQASAFKDSKFLDVKWIQAPATGPAGFQSFGVLAAVPEAGTMMLFGLLMAGGIVLLRSSKKNQTA